MPYAGNPILNTITLPLPNSADPEISQLGEDVELANGSVRRYDKGERWSIALTWSRLTEAQLDLIRTAAPRRAVVWVGQDGVTRTVLPGRPQARPLPATDPTRFDVTLTLVEQNATL